MKTDKTICCSTSFVMLSSVAMDDIAGATIEEETGDMNVKDDTTKVAPHLRFFDQFLGFSGSSGPSQVTYGHVQRL